MSTDSSIETQEISNEEVSISTEATPALFSIDNANMDELNALADMLSKAEAEVAQTPKQTETTIEEVENEEQKQAETQAEDEPLSVEDEDAQQPKVSDRVRLSALSNDDKHLVTTAVQLVKSGYARNITEALAQLAQDSDPQEERQEPAEQQPQAKAPVETSARISEIKAQLKAAKEDFDTDREIELLEELSDIKADIKLQAQQQKSIEAEQKSAENEAKQSVYIESIAKANAAFPDGAIPGTPFFNEVQKTVEEFQKSKPWMLEDPEYPNWIAGYVGMKLGVSPANANAVAPQAQQSPKPSQAPRIPARQASPMVGGNATTAVNRASVDSMISELTADQIDAVFRSAFA